MPVDEVDAGGQSGGQHNTSTTLSTSSTRVHFVHKCLTTDLQRLNGHIDRDHYTDCHDDGEGEKKHLLAPYGAIGCAEAF